MSTREKFLAIQELIHRDVGNRGLARDPKVNLLTATHGDWPMACVSIGAMGVDCLVSTGFFIPSGNPPSFETDGPLGAAFLLRAFHYCDIGYIPQGEPRVVNAIRAGLKGCGIRGSELSKKSVSHVIYVERAGPALDGKCYSMSGTDISPYMTWDLKWQPRKKIETIGIGDGGNEIGMGKIPHETIVKNIPNGDLIHCRVPTDYLIVAGVSNWGAYALAAGVALMRGVELPDELFDPDNERRILQAMVEAGPLVDGVTGQQTATVDGLTWDDYIRPLVEIGKIMKG